jgi:hypothetical protein
VLEIEGGKERDERGVGEIHDDEFARRKQPPALAGHHRGCRQDPTVPPGADA